MNKFHVEYLPLLLCAKRLFCTHVTSSWDRVFNNARGSKLTRTRVKESFNENESWTVGRNYLKYLRKHVSYGEKNNEKGAANIL